MEFGQDHMDQVAGLNIQETNAITNGTLPQTRLDLHSGVTGHSIEDLEVLDELVVVDRAGPAIKCNDLGGFPALSLVLELGLRNAIKSATVVRAVRILVFYMSWFSFGCLDLGKCFHDHP